MNILLRRTALAVMLALGLPAYAHAQADAPVETPPPPPRAEPRQLDAIEVQGVRIDAYAAPVTNVGLKLPLSQRETPQSVSVLTGRFLDDWGLDALDDAMKYVPGIAFEQYDSIDTFYISRGFEITNYQLDGLPVTQGRGNPRLAMYDRVEVLRGAAGLLNGAGDPGGVINLVRKRPTDHFSAQGALSAGSWDKVRVQGDVGGPLNADGSVRGRAVVESEDRDEFWAYGDYHYRLGYGVLDLDISPTGTFTVGASYEKRQMTPNWSGLPRYSDGGALDLSRRASLEPPWQDITTQARQVFADLRQGLGENWQLRASAQYAKESGTYLVANGSGAIDRDTGAGWSIYPTLQSRNYANQSIDVATLGKFTAWGRQHDLIFGISFTRDNILSGGDDFVESYQVDDVRTFDPHALPRPHVMAGNYTSSRYVIDQSGLYGVMRLHPTERLTALLGGRYSRWNETDTDLIPDRAVTADYGDHHLGLYGGLVYDLGEHWSAYASYADIFNVQSERSTSGQLPPVTGESYEAGIKGDWWDGALNASFALFDIRQKNRAQIDLGQPPGACNGDTCYLAQGEVKSRGFEATIAGRIAPGLNLSAGYTWNRQEYSRDLDSQGQPFNTYAPRQMVKLWASYQPAPAWSFGLGANWQTRTYATAWADDGSTFDIVQPAYAVWGAMVGYDFDEAWSLKLNVDNLFDKVYYETIGPTDWGNFWGAPRNAELTLKFSF